MGLRRRCRVAQERTFAWSCTSVFTASASANGEPACRHTAALIHGSLNDSLRNASPHQAPSGPGAIGPPDAPMRTRPMRCGSGGPECPNSSQAALAGGNRERRAWSHRRGPAARPEVPALRAWQQSRHPACHGGAGHPPRKGPAEVPALWHPNGRRGIAKIDIFAHPVAAWQCGPLQSTVRRRRAVSSAMLQRPELSCPPAGRARASRAPGCQLQRVCVAPGEPRRLALRPAKRHSQAVACKPLLQRRCCIAALAGHRR